MKLTKAAVEALTLPAGKTDHIIFDDAMPGFGVRLRAGGKRSFIVQYRSGHQQRRESLGDVRKVDIDEARRAAKRRLGAVALGHDPAAEKVEARWRAKLVLSSFVPRFLEHKRAEVRPGTFRNVARHVRYLEPLYERPIHEIARRDVAALVSEIRERRGKNPARETRQVLSELFAWLMGEGIADTNPVIGTNSPPPPDDRDRVLTDAELGAIWHAAVEVGDDYGIIIRLLILTACRRDEIGDLRWDEVDGHMLRVPGSRIKTGHKLELPLPPLALAVLDEVTSCRLGRGRRVFGEGKGRFSSWPDARPAPGRRRASIAALAAS
jgi:hypothetical protein